MINLVNIGFDVGNLTINAFNAIIESDIILNYDNIDLSDLDSYLKDKEIIVNEDLDSAESDADSSEHIVENKGESDSAEGVKDDGDSDSVEVVKDDEDDAESIGDSLKDELILEIDETEDDSDILNIYSKLNASYSKIELAISKSLDNNVTIIYSDNSKIFGLSNLLIQICSKYEDVELKIYPGVSSIDYASSVLGAPFNDFVAIDLNNPIVSKTELKNKIKFALKNDFILFIHNLVGNSPFISDKNANIYKLREIVNDFNDELMVGIVKGNYSYEICKFKDLTDEKLDENSTLVIGNKLTYKLEDYMVTSSDYIVEPKFISQNMDFFERYLKDETPIGIDYDCDYLPCHKGLEACDFCYCPFYPCADALTGGEWIKGKDVWSCQYCDWIHLETPCQTVREGLKDILEDPNDLKTKHVELLKLRRESLLKTLK